MLKEFPVLLLQHWIQLKPGTVPIAYKTHPITLALHFGVEAAVTELDAQGIWEATDKSGRMGPLLGHVHEARWDPSRHN